MEDRPEVSSANGPIIEKEDPAAIGSATKRGNLSDVDISSSSTV